MESIDQNRKLKQQLFYETKHLSKMLTQEQKKKAASFCEGYKTFLQTCKTERETVRFIVEVAKAKNFKPFEVGGSYQPGDRLYYVNRNKAILLITVGKQGLESGINIVASHIDSPRIDLKPRPLYEESEIAYFKTHYYGGIKKYQWPTLPLALHGKIIKTGGEQLDLELGEKDDDPVFCITDLLPHLADKQIKKPMSSAIEGENLNLIVGSLPHCSSEEEGSDLIKLGTLKHLNEAYGLTEKDLINSELSLVPALKPRDVGFDRSLVGAYGQDDRVCAYASLMAHLDQEMPNHTALTVFADKEETGSEGNTGLDSFFLEYFIQDLAAIQGADFRRVISNSKCFSADVNVAFDPSWASAFEKRNASLLNHGVVVTKYTGSRGKYSTSDASAEFLYEVTSLLDNNNIHWQTGLLGTVDTGGGGTVAKYIARLNIDVIDVGVAVLSMHSPYELTSKLDIFMFNLACAAFLKR